MRLIDADAVLKWFAEYWAMQNKLKRPSKQQRAIYMSMRTMVNSVKTEDAVPVEFIQKRIAELDKAIDYEFNELGEYNGWAIHAQSALEQLLQTWVAERKEE